MTRTTIHRFINAPVAVVFDTVAHIGNFSKAIPEIVNVEILSDVRSGVGARFRETRLTKGRRTTVELEVTEYAPNKRIRLVSDAGGTIWEMSFTTEATSKGTDLTMVMDAKPKNLFANIVAPLMQGMIQKSIERDMDAVKVYCEGLARD